MGIYNRGRRDHAIGPLSYFRKLTLKAAHTYSVYYKVTVFIGSHILQLSAVQYLRDLYCMSVI